MSTFAQPIAQKLNIKIQQVEAVLSLFEEGATIPFIARYRKDKTGALDEVQIQQIQDEAKFLKEFTERKTFIEKTITEQGKMTEALQAKIDKASAITELEDIYLPFKPKRKTKAQTARENGLEPLATTLLEQKEIDLQATAATFINEKVADADARNRKGRAGRKSRRQFLLCIYHLADRSGARPVQEMVVRGGALERQYV